MGKFFLTSLCTTHFRYLDYNERLNINLQNALVSIFMLDKVAKIYLKNEFCYIS